MNKPRRPCRQCGALSWTCEEVSEQFKTARWVCEECKLFTHVAMGDMICDICGSQPVIAAQRVAAYDSVQFNSRLLPRERMYALCEACKAPMARGDIQALVDRSVDVVFKKIIEKYPNKREPVGLRDAMRAEFYQTWSNVMTHRQGDPFELESN